MWSRVQRAGNLISYRAFSSSISDSLEEKILDLTIKMLSCNKELNEKDIDLTETVGIRLQNPHYNFTNVTTGLLEVSKNKSETLPYGEIRDKYKRTAILTQEFLNKSTDLFTRISEHYRFPGVNH